MTLVAEKLTDYRVQVAPPPEPVPTIERDRTPRGSFIFWVYPMVLVGGMALLLVMYLCQSAKIVGLQYRTVQLKEKQAALVREKTDLVLSVQELTSLSHIEHVATTRLGMVLPKQRLVLDLSENTSRQAMLRNIVASHGSTP